MDKINISVYKNQIVINLPSDSNFIGEYYNKGLHTQIEFEFDTDISNVIDNFVDNIGPHSQTKFVKLGNTNRKIALIGISSGIPTSIGQILLESGESYNLINNDYNGVIPNLINVKLPGTKDYTKKDIDIVSIIYFNSNI